MPYIKFYNLDDNQIQQIYNNSIAKMSNDLDTPQDKFSYINAGNILNHNKVFIEILWMPRSKDKEEIVVKILQSVTNHEVILYFTHINKDRHYTL